MEMRKSNRKTEREKKRGSNMKDENRKRKIQDYVLKRR